MTFVLPPSAIRSAAPPDLVSTSRIRWQARRGLVAVTGQTLTLTRASTATITDSAGATVTVGHSMPAYESRLWNSAPAIGLRLGADDLIGPLDTLPETGTLYVEAINLGTANTSGLGLVYLGRDDATGNRLVVRGTGTTFAVDLVIGANTSTATLPASVANGAAVALVVQIEDTGTTQRVRIGGRVAGADVGFATWGTAIARGSAWGAGARLRFNRTGTGGTVGAAWFRQMAWEAALRTADEMAARL